MIKVLTLEGQSHNILERVVAIYGDTSLPYAAVKGGQWSFSMAGEPILADHQPV